MATLGFFKETNNMVQYKVSSAEKNNELKLIEENIDCAFPMTLRKIEEVDEISSKTSKVIAEDGNGNCKVKKEKLLNRKEFKLKDRPRSADSVARVSLIENKLQRRPKSSSPLSPTENLGLKRIRGEVPEFKNRVLEDSHRKEDRTGSCKSLTGCSRSSSACGSSCCRSYRPVGTGRWITNYNSKYQVRKCRSNPTFSKVAIENYEKNFGRDKDFQKYKRSLKLLGFELSDFGIYGSPNHDPFKHRLKTSCSTFSTKLSARSVSLDSLRHAIRKAWLYDCLDNSHRKLLAQAAYEEWYFKKEAELAKKRDEEKVKKLKLQEMLEKEFVKKKKKAEEEFRKWSQRKRVKRKDLENSEQKSKTIFSRLTKTKEESEKAFIKWKKEKDKELGRKMSEKRKEEEKRMESEKQKREKRAEAEQAFQQWMIKFEKKQKIEAKRRNKLNQKQEEIERRKQRLEGSQVSFELWKAAKDAETKKRIRMQREAMRAAQEERLAQMEERMYEAEQAFEEWLERVDARHRQFAAFMSNQKKVPWLPV